MGKLKYETHAHTSTVSQCSIVSPEALVEQYIEAGYGGVVITDHLTPEFVAANGGAENWESAAEQFLKGYREAKAAVNGRDFDIFLGMELRFVGHNNEYLIYGFDESYLLNCGDITALQHSEYFSLINGKGIYMAQAHPFRNWMTILPPNKVHGIEIHNGNVRHDSRNHLAAIWAQDNALVGISGSDFHQLGDVSRGGILLDERPKNEKELADIIFNKKQFELIIV